MTASLSGFGCAHIREHGPILRVKEKVPKGRIEPKIPLFSARMRLWLLFIAVQHHYALVLAAIEGDGTVVKHLERSLLHVFARAVGQYRDEKKESEPGHRPKRHEAILLDLNSNRAADGYQFLACAFIL
jgi:hypothetical protein